MDMIGPSETGLMWPEQSQTRTGLAGHAAEGTKCSTAALYKSQSPRGQQSLDKTYCQYGVLLPASVTQWVLWTDAASIHGSWSKRAARCR
ncbi:hypothetical protein GMOD_00002035 [Pyrenophora seminiperda CCB06]|uniref:Uncharacterized protein n=1 Tax=Pyrenophora seminiperda CCB06 TaxID=1302712 RepID=A0A3M7LWY7_9PLEO|nr:hypothetical protein GMOD_00002035 [Pyrenophora seminiperda CCB06]